jgi:hypothetical protein
VGNLFGWEIPPKKALGGFLVGKPTSYPPFGFLVVSIPSEGVVCGGRSTLKNLQIKKLCLSKKSNKYYL